MNKFYYFKVAFLPASAGLFAGLFVYGLFDVDFSNGEAITELFIKTLATGFISGLVLGVLNIFFKIGFRKKDN